MSEARAWADLAPRVVSGLLMAAGGALLVWLGGWPFTALACILCGLMVWEAARMFGAQTPVVDAALAAGALLAAIMLPGLFVLPLLLGSAVVSAGRVARDKPLYGAFHAWIVLACFALVFWRESAGFPGLLWIALVVVASDVLGYFAGRMFGGPKFWPSVSPKKTWSGTVAGWAGRRWWAWPSRRSRGLAG